MIRKISLFLFIALLAAGLSMAATTAKPAAKSASAAVKGTVDKVDLTAHTISVMVGTESKNFTFNDKSYFFQGKTKVKVDQLKQGDKIAITADSKNYIRKADLEAAPTMTQQATH